MSAVTPEARARRSARQRERRRANPSYGRVSQLTVAERAAFRVAYLAVLGDPDGFAWHDRAACGPELAHLFSEPEGDERPEAREKRVASARRTCASCPVRRECLADAVDTDDRVTVRAGLTPAERAAAARKAAA